MNTINIAEQEAEELERKIVRFTNIDHESFTHSYRGITITVQAGESYVGRYPECSHLATHLARKILSREAKSKTSKDNTQIRLWTPDQVEELRGKILTPMGNETPAAAPTPEQKRKEDLEKIKSEFPPEPKEPVTKKEVIEELKRRGVEADVKKTLQELLQQLMELEAQGK
ncbi:MAG: hypothetical protein Q8N14_03590 [Candidatus Omnitrophota bacterium]|nr:hypothetical protein [Candidatus Omnitrophota bacterium]